MSLWLNKGFGLWGRYARTRVIFILGSGANAERGAAAPVIVVANTDLRKFRLFINLPE